jgi:hypothetical protein
VHPSLILKRKGQSVTTNCPFKAVRKTRTWTPTMPSYPNTTPASSDELLLVYAADQIQKNPEPTTLKLWARIVARRVYDGGLDFFRAWDAVWNAAVSAGMAQLVAQKLIGESFATAKEGVEA